MEVVLTASPLVARAGGASCSSVSMGDTTTGGSAGAAPDTNVVLANVVAEDLVMEGIRTLLAHRVTMVHQEGALARALRATNEWMGMLAAQTEELTAMEPSIIEHEAAMEWHEEEVTVALKWAEDAEQCLTDAIA